MRQADTLWIRQSRQQDDVSMPQYQRPMSPLWISTRNILSANLIVLNAVYMSVSGLVIGSHPVVLLTGCVRYCTQVYGNSDVSGCPTDICIKEDQGRDRIYHVRRTQRFPCHRC